MRVKEAGKPPFLCVYGKQSSRHGMFRMVFSPAFRRYTKSSFVIGMTAWKVEILENIKERSVTGKRQDF